MNFYDKIGKVALGSRLRRLSETVTEQAAQVYELYHVDMKPKWFPVYYALADGGQKSITQIALEIGHSHPSVSTIVKEMIKHGNVKESNNGGDGRKNYVLLTEKGLAVNHQIEAQYTDVNAAVEEAINETQHDIWRAIEEWEFLLEHKSLLKRVQEQKKKREALDVEIVDYHPRYKPAFKALNEAWISTHFKMEETDYKTLDHPESYILDKGGQIVFALYKGEPVGTCALIRMDDNTFELAKMAVAVQAKGKGIGELLGNAVMQLAKTKGAKKLYLESNTMLKPAISLYHKLGFKKVAGTHTLYERCNIQMEVLL